MRILWGVLAGLLLLAVGAGVGWLWADHRRQDITPELLDARIRADSFKLARVADSIELARARDTTDAAKAAARNQVARARTAELVTAAYRDSVTILSDSLAAVVSNAGVVDTQPLPPAVVSRMRADAVTISEKNAAIDSLNAAVDAADTERAKAQRLQRLSDSAYVHLRDKQMPLEISAAYARGKSVGRKQGIVLGTAFGISVTFAGAKVAQATK